MTGMQDEKDQVMYKGMHTAPCSFKKSELEEIM